MKKNIFLFLVLSVSSLSVSANTDRYRLVITDNPSTTITIAWDQLSGSNPVIHFGSTDHGMAYQNYPSSKSPDRIVSYKGMNNHFAKLNGLSPNTAYYFVIRDSQGTSSRYWFKTAPATNEAMSFISGGDSRNNRVPRQNANMLVSKLKPTAVFFGGDMTNGDSNTEWIEWMDDWQLTIASDGRMFPIIPARGNHEASNASVYDLFNTPSSEVYYSITFGQDLYTLYTLNSEITAGGNQLTWLQNQLNSDQSVWKSAQYHKPMRPHQSAKVEGNDEYNNWAQLFYDKGVNLVYESDSHIVKTTYPVKPCSGGVNCDQGFEVDNNFGTVYVGEGCWGAPLRAADDNKPWTRDSGSFNQFKWVTVSTNQITLKTIMVDNANSVSENSNNEAPGVLPNGIQIWNPTNGSTVVITNNTTIPSVAITNPLNESYVSDGNNISITADASDPDGTVSQVEFFVNDISIGVDTTSPFGILHNFGNGSSTIKAVVTDNDTNTSTDEIVINVGSYNASQNFIANQDAEELISNGSMYLTSSDLEMVYDSYVGGDQVIGLQFNNITVPLGATITSAHVQFTAKTSENSSGTFNIYVEDATTSAPLSTGTSDISGRSYHSPVSWSPGNWSANAATVNERTSDISNAIQAAISNTSWASGQTLTLKIEAVGGSVGTGVPIRTAYSIDGGFPPELFIEYQVNGGGNSAPLVSITTPSDQAQIADGSNVLFEADASDSDGTIANVEFFVDGVSVGLDTTSPYSLNHNLTAGSHSIQVIATDNDGSTGTDTITVLVGGSGIVSSFTATEDAEEKVSDGLMYLTSSDLEFGYDSAVGGDQIIGIRFDNVTIPQGATINQAYVQFTAKVSDNSTGTFNAAVEDNVNANSITGDVGNISNRTYLLSTTWSPDQWTAGQAYASERTSDLSGGIQTNVMKSNWSSGNAIFVKIEGTANTSGTTVRTGFSIEGGAAPVLVIDYSTGSAPMPVADFSFDSSNITTGESVAFTDLSSGNPSSWNWTFEGGSPSNSTAQHPTVIYNVPGTYDVVLTATNAAGSDTHTKLACITVSEASGCNDLSNDSFETGFGNWNSGGKDTSLSTSQANSGSQCVRLKSSGTSASITSNAYDLGGVSAISFSLSFITNGADAGEGLLLEMSTNGGTSFSTIRTWNEGSDFTDNVRLTETFDIQETFASSTVFRLRSTLSHKNESVYIDDITVSECLVQASRTAGSSEKMAYHQNQDVYKLFPTITTGRITVSIQQSKGIHGDFMIFNLNGQLMKSLALRVLSNNEQLDVHLNDLSSGMYLAVFKTTSGTPLFVKNIIKK